MTRTTKASISLFYNSSWLTSPDIFLQEVPHFERIIAGVSRLLQQMDPILKYSIVSAVTSSVIATFATSHVNNDNNIRFLGEILEKVLLAKDFIPLSSLLLGHNNLLFNTQAFATVDSNPKFTSALDLTSKTSQEK